jgi:4-hydroxy-tetrahydrodipicolinate synthase/2-dehydro-3-deoxy-phosphogluconate/2-dehydro-3-deoxy-6-phosphogalactonate aldolase
MASRTQSAPDPGDADPLALRGVVPPTVTAFDESEAVDYERTAEHAQFVVDGGADAVFPLGTNGEFALLTAEERRGVVEAVCDAVEDAPVIAGVGAPGTAETVAHARHAERVGADGLVVVTPFYYPTDGRALFDHYRRVCEAVELPVYVYHIPSKTGNSISLDVLDDLAAIDGIAGVKDSSKDVPFLGQAIDAHPELTFLSGSDSLLFPGLEVGCAGLVSAVANAFPEPVAELYAAYDAGEEERARELQSRIYRIRTALKDGPYMAGVKTALKLRGFDCGPLRSPLRTMDDAQRDELADTLAELGLLG